MVKSREFGQPIEILKFNDFKGEPCMVSDSGVTADANGLKIVKAGTPHPANDGTYKERHYSFSGGESCSSTRDIF